MNNNGLVSELFGIGAGASRFVYAPARNVYTRFLPIPSTVAQGINDQGRAVGSVALAPGVARPVATDCPAGVHGFLRSPAGAIAYFLVNGSDTRTPGTTDSSVITGFPTVAGQLEGFIGTLARCRTSRLASHPPI